MWSSTSALSRSCVTAACAKRTTGVAGHGRVCSEKSLRIRRVKTTPRSVCCSQSGFRAKHASNGKAHNSAALVTRSICSRSRASADPLRQQPRGFDRQRVTSPVDFLPGPLARVAEQVEMSEQLLVIEAGRHLGRGVVPPGGSDVPAVGGESTPAAARSDGTRSSETKCVPEPSPACTALLITTGKAETDASRDGLGQFVYTILEGFLMSWLARSVVHTGVYTALLLFSSGKRGLGVRRAENQHRGDAGRDPRVFHGAA